MSDPGPARCPACGALLPPQAPWCPLCYTDLRPASADRPAAADRPGTEPGAGQPATGDPDETGPAARAVASGPGPAPETVDALLAQLAAQEGGDALPAGPLRSRGSRVVLTILGAVGLAVLLVVVGWLVGHWV